MISFHEQLSSCRMCPRNCGANRLAGEKGYCRSDAAFRISSICVHKGEEPVISGTKGICNVFFPHCNLQCIYCQNHEISDNHQCQTGKEYSLEEVTETILNTLKFTENVVGFVSPSHYIPHVIRIIHKIKEAGLNPVFVYNTNGYDSVDSLKLLEGLVDIYLPDFKYADSTLAEELSGARDYPQIATAALKEMYRQKGSSLIINDDGIAESGIIIRHLVLPHQTAISKKVLDGIADETSSKMHISLMAQYYPTSKVQNHKYLNRALYREEYEEVLNHYYELGFYRGWVQELESNLNYKPDFKNSKPFGD